MDCFVLFCFPYFLVAEESDIGEPYVQWPLGSQSCTSGAHTVCGWDLGEQQIPHLGDSGCHTESSDVPERLILQVDGTACTQMTKQLNSKET